MDECGMTADPENGSYFSMPENLKGPVTNGKTIKCVVCKVAFPSLELLNHHENFQKCKFVSDGRVVRQASSRKFLRKKISCNVCRKGFLSKKRLLKHKNLKKCKAKLFKKNQKQYLYPQLQNGLSKEKCHDDHMIHEAESLLTDKNYQEIVKPEKSKKQLRKKRLFKCTFCGITCITEATFVRHKSMTCKYRSYQMHQGELEKVKPFLCQNCGTGFLYRRNLLKHERQSKCYNVGAHKMNQEFPVKQESPRELTADETFEKHEDTSVEQSQSRSRKRTKTRRMKRGCHDCEFCMESFKSKPKFDSHHTVKCKKKSKLGKLAHSVVTSIKEMASRIFVNCNDCGFRFRKQKYLNQHLKLKRCKGPLSKTTAHPKEEVNSVEGPVGCQENGSRFDSGLNNNHGKQDKGRVQGHSLHPNLDGKVSGTVKEEVEDISTSDSFDVTWKRKQSSQRVLHDLTKVRTLSGSSLSDDELEKEINSQDISKMFIKEESCEFYELSQEENPTTKHEESFIKCENFSACESGTEITESGKKSRGNNKVKNSLKSASVIKAQGRKTEFSCRRKVTKKLTPVKCDKCGHSFFSVSNLNKHVKLNRCKNISKNKKRPSNCTSQVIKRKYPLRNRKRNTTLMLASFSPVRNEDWENRLSNESDAVISDLSSDGNVLQHTEENKKDESHSTVLADAEPLKETGVLSGLEMCSVESFDIHNLPDRLKSENQSYVDENLPEKEISGMNESIDDVKQIQEPKIRIKKECELFEPNSLEDNTLSSFGRLEDFVKEGFIKDEPLYTPKSGGDFVSADRNYEFTDALENVYESSSSKQPSETVADLSFEAELMKKRKSRICECGRSFVSMSNLNRHIRLKRCKSGPEKWQKIESSLMSHYLKRQHSSKERKLNKRSVLFSPVQVRKRVLQKPKLVEGKTSSDFSISDDLSQDSKEGQKEKLPNEKLVDSNALKIANVLQNVESKMVKIDEFSISDQIQSEGHQSQIVEGTCKATSSTTTKEFEVIDNKSEVISSSLNVEKSHSNKFDFKIPAVKSEVKIERPVHCNECGRTFLRKKYLAQHKKLNRCRKILVEHVDIPVSLDNVVKDGSEECNAVLPGLNQNVSVPENLGRNRAYEKGNVHLSEEREDRTNRLATKLSYLFALNLIPKNLASEYTSLLKSGGRDACLASFRNYQADKLLEDKEEDKSSSMQQKTDSPVKRERSINCSECGRQFLRKKYLLQHLKLNRCKSFLSRQQRAFQLKLESKGDDCDEFYPTAHRDISSESLVNSNEVDKPYFEGFKREDHNDMYESAVNEQIDLISREETGEEKLRLSLYQDKTFQERDIDSLENCSDTLPPDILSGHSHGSNLVPDLKKYKKDRSKSHLVINRHPEEVNEGKKTEVRMEFTKPLSVVQSQGDHASTYVSGQNAIKADHCPQEDQESALNSLPGYAEKNALKSYSLRGMVNASGKEMPVYCPDCGRHFLRKKCLVQHKKLNRCKGTSRKESQTLKVRSQKILQDCADICHGDNMPSDMKDSNVDVSIKNEVLYTMLEKPKVKKKLCNLSSLKEIEEKQVVKDPDANLNSEADSFSLQEETCKLRLYKDKRNHKSDGRPSVFPKIKINAAKSAVVYCNECGRRFLRKRYLYAHKKLNRCKIGVLQERLTYPVKQEYQEETDSAKSLNVTSSPSFNDDIQRTIVRQSLGNVFNSSISATNQDNSEVLVKSKSVKEQRKIELCGGFSPNQTRGKDLSMKSSQTKTIKENEVDSVAWCSKVHSLLDEEKVDGISVSGSPTQNHEVIDRGPEYHKVNKKKVADGVFKCNSLDAKHENKLFVEELPNLLLPSNTRLCDFSLQGNHDVPSSSGKISKKKMHRKPFLRCQRCAKCFSSRSSLIKHCKMRCKRNESYQIHASDEQENELTQENCFSECGGHCLEKEHVADKNCHGHRTKSCQQSRSLVMSELQLKLEEEPELEIQLKLEDEPELELQLKLEDEPNSESESDHLHESHSNCICRILREARERKLYTCCFCRKKFSKLSNLNRHFKLKRCKNMQSEFIPSCCICGKDYSSLSNLNRHLKSRKCRTAKQKFTPWKCPCGKYFSTSSNLSRHQKLNKNQKLKLCNPLQPENPVPDEQNGLLGLSLNGLSSNCHEVNDAGNEQFICKSECSEPNSKLEGGMFCDKSILPRIIVKDEHHESSASESLVEGERSYLKPDTENSYEVSTAHSGTVSVKGECSYLKPETESSYEVLTAHGETISVRYSLTEKAEKELRESDIMQQKQDLTDHYSHLFIENPLITNIEKLSSDKLTGKPFKCHICGKGFLYSKNRVRHLRLKRCKFLPKISKVNKTKSTKRHVHKKGSDSSLKIKSIKIENN